MKHFSLKRASRLICAALALTLLSGLCAIAEEQDAVVAPDFTLQDQYGETWTLSECVDKVVFLNFWATWCPWCIKEMPEIDELYHELGENQGDVLIFGIAAPGTYDDATEDEITAFLEEHAWSYPTLMDTTGEVFTTYGASSLPTTWLVRADGTLMGYVAGALSKDEMTKLINITIEGVLPENE